MVLNCGIREDSWESLGLQGDQTSQSQSKSIVNVHWKDWCWSWNSNTLATWCEELTHWKDPDAGKDWRQEEKGMTEDEMVGWHHRLDGHEFEQAPGLGDGQGSLACCSPWDGKESDMRKRLSWNELRVTQFLKFWKWIMTLTFSCLGTLNIFIGLFKYLLNNKHMWYTLLCAMCERGLKSVWEIEALILIYEFFRLEGKYIHRKRI